jgi:hypothetical protein
MVTSGYDGAVRLWHIPSGRQVRMLTVALNDNKSPPPWAYAVAFAPDGRSIAAAYRDNSVRLWETATGQERTRFDGHRSATLALAFSPDGALLASGSADRTAVVWDLTGKGSLSLQRKAPKGPKDLEARWPQLGERDVRIAYSALQAFVVAGPATISFFRTRLQPVRNVDDQQVDVWIGQLDSQSFKERELATSELQKTGDGAEAALRKALQRQPSLEMRRRIEYLLERLEPPSPIRLCYLRAIEILEHFGTTDARQLLQNLAQGSEASWLTHEARSSLERLKELSNRAR